MEMTWLETFRLLGLDLLALLLLGLLAGDAVEFCLSRHALPPKPGRVRGATSRVRRVTTAGKVAR